MCIFRWENKFILQKYTVYKKKMHNWMNHSLFFEVGIAFRETKLKLFMMQEYVNLITNWTITCCNIFLFKCRYRFLDNCNMCYGIANIRHLILDCIHVQYVCKNLDRSFGVLWKHRFLDFPTQNVIKVNYLITVISCIISKICKWKWTVDCRNKLKRETMYVSCLTFNLLNNINANWWNFSNTIA